MDRQKKNSKRRLKSGSYSAAITVLVVAFIVVVNLIINALPASMTKFDFTEQQMYTLSEQTKKLVKGLDEEITIYVIAQKDNEDSRLKAVLEKYQALSSKINVEYKDPAVYPTFVAQYSDSSLQDNSVIVVSGNSSRVVAAIEMYDNLELNETTRVYELTDASTFIGEDMVTSAIDYVTTDNLPKMYILTGHGEQAIGSFSSEIQRENIVTETLQLAKAESIPKDAACLLMEAPSKDISASEAELLSEYLEDGGKFFYVSYVFKEETPNLDALLADYGIKIDKGYVCESSGNYYGNYPMWISPVYGSHSIVNPLAQNQTSMMVVAPQNIEILESKPSGITITPLLRTTSAAYLKEVDANTDMSTVSSNKEDGDKTGVMNLSVAVERFGETQMVIATTYELFDQTTNQQVSGGNYDFLLNAISSLCEHDSMVSIRGKQLYSDSLTVTSGHTMIWIFVLMILIPLVCLITGLVLWVRRRKH